MRLHYLEPWRRRKESPLRGRPVTHASHGERLCLPEISCCKYCSLLSPYFFRLCEGNGCFFHCASHLFLWELRPTPRDLTVEARRDLFSSHLTSGYFER